MCISFLIFHCTYNCINKSNWGKYKAVREGSFLAVCCPRKYHQIMTKSFVFTENKRVPNRWFMNVIFRTRDFASTFSTQVQTDLDLLDPVLLFPGYFYKSEIYGNRVPNVFKQAECPRSVTNQGRAKGKLTWEPVKRWFFSSRLGSIQVRSNLDEIYVQRRVSWWGSLTEEHLEFRGEKNQFWREEKKKKI